MTTYAEPGHLPKPAAGESPNGPAQVGALADRLAAILEAKTTAQIAALAGTDLWVGRLLLDSTLGIVVVCLDDAPPTWAIVGISDHGGLGGLGDNDHPQYPLKATLTAKGSLYVATAAGVVAELVVGTNGKALLADSTAGGGVAWGDVVRPALVDAKGDLLAGTANDALGRLAVGANGKVLTADSAEATGIKWADAAGGGLVDALLMGGY